ncbi:MAG TPA: phenylalanine 4-monooxygenase [Nitriliruptorales bacterium]
MQHLEDDVTLDDAVVAYGGDLAEDHPGFTDAAYRARRAAIGRLAEGYELGDPVREVPYAAEEHAVWATVLPALRRLHERHAPSIVVQAGEALTLPTDRVPQLDEVSELLADLSGFRYAPVPGLLEPRAFYGSLGDRTFRSTQYIRHASQPFYTPEPDVIHEVVGHGTHLATPRFAELYRQVGAAARRTTEDQALQFLSRVFWYTVEFGVVREGGQIKAYGAGLLSSVGELQTFAREAEMCALDLLAMGTSSYDIATFQPVLYAADSVEHLFDTLGTFLERFDDDHHARLVTQAA